MVREHSSRLHLRAVVAVVFRAAFTGMWIERRGLDYKLRFRSNVTGTVRRLAQHSTHTHVLPTNAASHTYVVHTYVEPGAPEGPQVRHSRTVG